MKQDKNNVQRNESIEKTGEILLYLVACALNDTVPDKKIYTQVDERFLYAAACNHSVLSMVAFALEQNAYQGISPEAVVGFRTGKDRAIRKNMLLNAEREAILSYLEEEGIRYLPLKGILLQTYYPEFGMRQMADNDIFYDRTFQQKVKDFMISRGFKPESVGKGIHDSYFKAPVHNFELHTQILSDIRGDGVIPDYYHNVWEMAVPDPDKKYGYHFKDEDFYVYVLAHAAKHHENSGTGIRTLADVYIMNRTFADVDRTYIQEQLAGLGLSSLEQKLRLLSERLLADPAKTVANARALSEEERSALDFILSSGTYGTTRNHVKSSLRRQEGRTDGKVSTAMRLRYYKNRVFPGRDYLYPFYPLAKYRILLPLVWLQRIFSACTVRRKAIRHEIDAVRKQTEL